MFYKNARIFYRGEFHQGGFEVTENGCFGQVLPAVLPEEAVDLKEATVIPGLIDVHIHGAMGSDFSDGDLTGNEAMAAYLAGCGVTSFAPASMTLPYETLEKAFAAGRTLADHRPEGCARLMGVQMEGPYFSEKKKGAQNGAYLKDPDFAGFEKLFAGCKGLIRIVDIAPERPGAEEFIRAASRLCRVSVAHTDATYEEAAAGFAAGATHLTHLFNAMPGIHHRAPGVIAAAAENENVTAELICDGIHVHPGAVKLAFKLFGKDRMVLVSDALRCCGMPDGEYTLGGQQVYLHEGVARLADGVIAGSATNLFECMRRAIRFGIPEADAVAAATCNPARALRAEDKIGAIETGLYADFVVCDESYNIQKVYMSGKSL